MGWGYGWVFREGDRDGGTGLEANCPWLNLWSTNINNKAQKLDF